MIKTIIVEDQEFIRKSLKIVLERISDISIIGMAANGKEAIDLCEKEDPEMVLMDIQMPEMDGVKATEEIKKRMPHIKVIILTTFQDFNYVMNALNAGAEGYILKAVDPLFLVTGIQMVYHGGSLLPQELAKEVFQSFNPSEEKGVFGQSPAVKTYEINQQELKVLKYLSQGLSNKAISERMFCPWGR